MNTRAKPPEVLFSQVNDIESSFVFPETLPPPDIDIHEIIELPEAMLLSSFSSRFSYYRQLYALKKAGRYDERVSAEAEKWYGMMNSLYEYTQAAELNPGTGVLYEEQVPVMRSLVNFFENHIRSEPRGIIRIPTGVGKTVLFSELVRTLGLRTLVVTPTNLLTDQVREELVESPSHTIEVEIFDGTRKTEGKDLTITTYASFIRQMKMSPKQRVLEPNSYELLILDEGHNALGIETRRALRAMDHAIWIACTATPIYTNPSERKRRRELMTILPHLIHNMSINEAVQKRLLAPFGMGLVYTQTHLDDVPLTFSQEYAAEPLEAAINIDQRDQIAIEMYLKLFPDQQAIAFCGGVQHALDFAERCRSHGIHAVAVHGKSKNKSEIRDQANKSIAEGGPQILCNDKLLTEGFDAPNISICFNMAPTRSIVRAQQRGGRVLRRSRQIPHKFAYIIEFIDEDDRFAPALFADPEIANNVFISPEPEDELPNYLQAADGESFAGCEFVTDVERVMEAVDEIHSRSTDERLDPPQGWLPIQTVSTQFGVPVHFVQRKLRLLAHDEGQWFEANNARYRNVNGRSAIHYSPELLTRLYEIMDLPDPAPSHWRTANQIALLYGYPYEKTFKELRLLAKEIPSESGFYATTAAKHYSRMHFSPTVQKLFAEKLGVEHIHDKAPSHWLTRNDLRQVYGSRAADEAISFILRRSPGLAESSVLFFEDDKGVEAEHYSPIFVKRVADSFKPPSNWQMMSKLPEILGRSKAEIEAAMALVDSSKLTRSTKICLVGTTRRRFYSPKYIAAIEKALRHPDLTPAIRTINLPETTAEDQWLPSDKLDSVFSQNLEELFAMSLDVASRFRNPTGSQKFDYEVYKPLLKIMEQFPSIFYNLKEWYTVTEIAEVFRLNPHDVKKRVFQKAPSFKGETAVVTIQMEGAYEVLVCSELAANIIELLTDQ